MLDETETLDDAATPAEDGDDLEGRIARTVGKIGTFKEEMAEMPALQRRIVYCAIFFTIMLFVQSVFIMPLILIKYGWGYNVG
jgi:hypothetical protein